MKDILAVKGVIESDTKEKDVFFSAATFCETT